MDFRFPLSCSIHSLLSPSLCLSCLILFVQSPFIIHMLKINIFQLLSWCLVSIRNSFIRTANSFYISEEHINFQQKYSCQRSCFDGASVFLKPNFVSLLCNEASLNTSNLSSFCLELARFSFCFVLFLFFKDMQLLKNVNG